MSSESSRSTISRDARNRLVGWGILLGVAFGVIGGVVLREMRHASFRGPGWVTGLTADVGKDAFIPNDIYGHLHDELEELLVSEVLPGEGAAPVGPAVPWPRVPVSESTGVKGLRDAGARGVPHLLGLLTSQPTLWERMRERLGLNLRIPSLLFHAEGAAGRRRMAAMLGFEILG